MPPDKLKPLLKQPCLGCCNDPSAKKVEHGLWVQLGKSTVAQEDPLPNSQKDVTECSFIQKFKAPIQVLRAKLYNRIGPWRKDWHEDHHQLTKRNPQGRDDLRRFCLSRNGLCFCSSQTIGPPDLLSAQPEFTLRDCREVSQAQHER